jgi:hypothetical protein
MMRVIAASLLVLTVACSSGGSDEPDPAPVLEVTSPARGTFADSETVTVAGRVTDNGSVRVTIGGTEVTPAKDGTFSATVPVTEGVAIIETHAIDGAGNDVRDVRAVLAGTMAPSDGTAVGMVGARAGITALRKVGEAVATQANNIDFNAAALAMNPVYEDSGCLGAKINITNVALGDMTVALAPKTSALSTDVAIPNIVVKLSASFKVACIGGSTTITVRSSKARIHGDLSARISSGKIVTSLPGATVALDGFSIDVGGVPGAIESLLKGQARDAVEKLLTNQIKAKVPPMADKALAGLIAKPITTELLGKDTTFSVAPDSVSITSTELFVGLAMKVKVAGGEGGTFMTTDANLTTSTMNATQGLGVALDDDVLNQLFAGLWAADALDQSIAIDSIPALGALLDDDSRTMDIKLSLPPTVSTDTGELVLALGDMMLTVRDEAGAEVHSIAVSISTTLAAEPSQSGKILLTVGAPKVYAQVLANSDAVEDPLEAALIEAIVTGAWGLVEVKADEALSNLPMPTIAGIQLGAPTIEAATGFVLADIPVM